MSIDDTRTKCKSNADEDGSSGEESDLSYDTALDDD